MHVDRKQFINALLWRITALNADEVRRLAATWMAIWSGDALYAATHAGTVETEASELPAHEDFCASLGALADETGHVEALELVTFDAYMRASDTIRRLARSGIDLPDWIVEAALFAIADIVTAAFMEDILDRPDYQLASTPWVAAIDDDPFGAAYWSATGGLEIDALVTAAA